MSLPKGFKDANDMLKEGKFVEFTSCWWDSKTYTPAGVINVFDKKEAFHNRKKKPTIPFAWEGVLWFRDAIATVWDAATAWGG